MKIISTGILVIASFLLIVSCTEKKDDPVDMGYEYWPVNIGDYHIYQVDSIVWDDFYDPVQIDTFSYKVKEVIASEIEDAESRKAFRVERFIKQHDSLEWSVDKIYKLQKLQTKVLKMIDNQTFVKFVFPVKNGVEWNSNVYNSNPPKTYEFRDTHLSYEVDGVNYTETSTVQQNDLVTLISNDVAFEIYAKGYGMVYKEDISQELDISTGEIESGYKYTYKLLEYGE
ncbi:MAG: hypothetical protein K9H84_07475 [Bacteroidales bacterium]|nr:hypothetical protein [Bacteroidales bacterium]